DLSAPLGLAPKKRRFALPIRLSHLMAGVPALCLLVFAGWAVFANDPYGGEPMAVVSADLRAPQQGGGAASAARRGAAGTGAAPRRAAAGSAEGGASPAPGGQPAPAAAAAPAGQQTITIIDGMSGKRQEFQIPASDPTTSAPPVDHRLIETSRHGTLPKVAT